MQILESHNHAFSDCPILTMLAGNALNLQTLPTLLRLPSHLPFPSSRVPLTFLTGLHHPRYNTYIHTQHWPTDHSHNLTYKTAHPAAIPLETPQRYNTHVD